MKVSFSIKFETRWGESLAVVLGDRSHLLRWNEGGFWSDTIDIEPQWLEDYTYVVIEDGIITRREWSHHHSPKATVIEDSWIDCPIPGCPFIQEHQASVFDRPGFRGAGVAVPVFSLRTADDFGIGEFNDLRPLADWAAATGQCIIQLLPVNDTTRKGGWEDSYPYSPVSSFALNPMYIHLQDLGVEEDEAFKALQNELNALPELDYPRVFKAKREYTLAAFAGASDLDSVDFKEFARENAFWLDGYAAFCSERDSLPEEYFRWIQWHLEKQFTAVVDYARSKGVHFKGDLPIGVSADSAEAHFYPQLFNLDSTAGAPPDYFSKEGQNWGFPTYNWEEMAKDEYAWWKSRLRKMSRFFDAFRIDHILGFFRIWEIPAGCSGLWGHFNPALPYSADDLALLGLPVEGLFHEDPRNPGMYQPMITPQTEGGQRFNELYTDFFYHRHDDFWRRNALKKLPYLLGATGMLACGEDLGMVPDCVPGVMFQEKILSLEMSEMEKGRPWPYLAVCATSSHDMETLRMQMKRRNGYDPTPEEVCGVIKGHLSSAPMLAINPLQDYLAMDGELRLPDCMKERINEPADPHHHWRYRVHIELEELVGKEEFCARLLAMVRESGRLISPRQ